MTIFLISAIFKHRASYKMHVLSLYPVDSCSAERACYVSVLISD
uniref:Uncharacterized protein n=1 Tax=Myoviridae sp. ctBtT5 TaxID=2825048 RepID=A0A8S5PZR2_9CAUD|nr:MAG TPA: hypothetical protein [Myoviridae sp. ctBtT5]